MWDAFRLFSDKVAVQLMTKTGEGRLSTSNIGHLNPPSMIALANGLNKTYYSINIKTYTTSLENEMLLNIYKPQWTQGIKLENSQSLSQSNCEKLK